MKPARATAGLGALAVVALAVGVLAGSRQHAEPAVDLPFVPAARTATAPLSIPHHCEAPAGDQLTDWLADLPPDATARLQAGACYALDGGVRVVDARGLTLDGAGATLRAVDAAAGSGRVMVEVLRGSDVTLRHLVLRGALPAGLDVTAGYRSPDEWQHGISFRGTQGAVVDDVEVTQVLGDFVYLGPDSGARPWTPTREVTVSGSRFSGSGRQGVTVTHAERVRIIGNSIAEVAANAVDIEPGASFEVAKDVTVEDNTFSGYRFSAVASTGSAAPGNVTGIAVRRNASTTMAPTCQPWMVVGAGGAGYRIEDNTMLSFRAGVALSGVSDVRITGNSVRSTGGNGQCRNDYGVLLAGVTDAVVQGNRFGRVRTAVRQEGSTNGIAARDNAVEP